MDSCRKYENWHLLSMEIIIVFEILSKIQGTSRSVEFSHEKETERYLKDFVIRAAEFLKSNSERKFRIK